MNILVLVENYPTPSGGNYNLVYVHTRNIYYVAADINVDVLNFSTNHTYIVDGIRVISLADYTRTKKQYDCLILHAANIRHHYLFIRKYGECFKKYIFFFHGHEVLRTNKVYSKPYHYVRRSKIKEFFQDIYDVIKLCLWKNYLLKISYKSKFVFVSNWTESIT